MRQLLVFDDPNFQRIDVFLASKAPFSRSFFSRLIESGGVYINGKAVLKAGFCPKLGDLIEFDTSPSISSEKSIKADDIQFKVVDEQDDFLIIDKPSGLLVHSTSPNCTEYSLVDGLNAQFFSSQSMPKELRGGIVHRLDKETSGLLLVAKNIQALSALSMLFLERKVHKTYLAIVCGNLEKSGKVATPIGRNPVDRHKRSCYGIGMKEASTEFESLEHFNDYTFVRVKIHTGRTHQIRVHMAWIGHPVLGDFLYGQKTDLINRQALHAENVSFCFKTTEFSYKCDLPDDFKKLLEFLRERK